MSAGSGLGSKGEKNKKFSAININNYYQGVSIKSQKSNVTRQVGLQPLGKVGVSRRLPSSSSSSSSSSTAAAINASSNNNNEINNFDQQPQQQNLHQDRPQDVRDKSIDLTNNNKNNSITIKSNTSSLKDSISTNNTTINSATLPRSSSPVVTPPASNHSRSSDNNQRVAEHHSQKHVPRIVAQPAVPPIQTKESKWASGQISIDYDAKLQFSDEEDDKVKVRVAQRSPQAPLENSIGANHQHNPQSQSQSAPKQSQPIPHNLVPVRSQTQYQEIPNQQFQEDLPTLQYQTSQPQVQLHPTLQTQSPLRKSQILARSQVQTDYLSQSLVTPPQPLSQTKQTQIQQPQPIVNSLNSEPTTQPSALPPPPLQHQVTTTIQSSPKLQPVPSQTSAPHPEIVKEESIQAPPAVVPSQGPNSIKNLNLIPRQQNQLNQVQRPLHINQQHSSAPQRPHQAAHHNHLPAHRQQHSNTNTNSVLPQRHHNPHQNHIHRQPQQHQHNDHSKRPSNRQSWRQAPAGPAPPAAPRTIGPRNYQVLNNQLGSNGSANLNHTNNISNYNSNNHVNNYNIISSSNSSGNNSNAITSNNISNSVIGSNNNGNIINASNTNINSSYNNNRPVFTRTFYRSDLLQ